MLRAVLAFLMILFVTSHGGLGGSAAHEHGKVHVHNGSMHEHHAVDEDRSDRTDQDDRSDELAFHVHLVADRTPAGHQMVAPPPIRATFASDAQYALASMSSAPPLEPPEAA